MNQGTRIFAFMLALAASAKLHAGGFEESATVAGTGSLHTSSPNIQRSPVSQPSLKQFLDVPNLASVKGLLEDEQLWLHNGLDDNARLQIALAATPGLRKEFEIELKDLAVRYKKEKDPTKRAAIFLTMDRSLELAGILNVSIPSKFRTVHDLAQDGAAIDRGIKAMLESWKINTRIDDLVRRGRDYELPENVGQLRKADNEVSLAYELRDRVNQETEKLRMPVRKLNVSLVRSVVKQASAWQGHNSEAAQHIVRGALIDYMNAAGIADIVPLKDVCVSGARVKRAAELQDIVDNIVRFGVLSVHTSILGSVLPEGMSRFNEPYSSLRLLYNQAPYEPNELVKILIVDDLLGAAYEAASFAEKIGLVARAEKEFRSSVLHSRRVPRSHKPILQALVPALSRVGIVGWPVLFGTVAVVFIYIGDITAGFSAILVGVLGLIATLRAVPKVIALISKARAK